MLNFHNNKKSEMDAVNQLFSCQSLSKIVCIADESTLLFLMRSKWSSFIILDFLCLQFGKEASISILPDMQPVEVANRNFGEAIVVQDRILFYFQNFLLASMWSRQGLTIFLSYLRLVILFSPT